MGELEVGTNVLFVSDGILLSGVVTKYSGNTIYMVECGGRSAAFFRKELVALA